MIEQEFIPATLGGKEYALSALKKRKEENAKKEKIDNSSLEAGSPMYFYCKVCGGLADTLPENYLFSAPKKLCKECQALKDCGWLE